MNGWMDGNENTEQKNENSTIGISWIRITIKKRSLSSIIKDSVFIYSHSRGGGMSGRVVSE